MITADRRPTIRGACCCCERAKIDPDGCNVTYEYEDTTHLRFFSSTHGTGSVVRLCDACWRELEILVRKNPGAGTRAKGVLWLNPLTKDEVIRDLRNERDTLRAELARVTAELAESRRKAAAEALRELAVHFRDNYTWPISVEAAEEAEARADALWPRKGAGR